MDQETSRAPNPFLEPWTGPFGAPPFDRLKPSHFGHAFEIALADAQAETGAIAADPKPPSFETTIEALERSGRELTRICSVFFNLARADTNDELEATEREIAPKLARHRSGIYLNGAMFQRVDALYSRCGELGLNAEQACRRKSLVLVLAATDDLAGLPASLVSAAARTAAYRGLPGKHGVTLSRSSISPFLQFSTRRDLREKAFRAWAQRGESGGLTENRAIASEIVRLRTE